MKFGTEVDYHMLISILIFLFSKFFSLIILGQIWYQNLKFSRLNEIWYRGRNKHMVIYLCTKFFSGKFGTNILSFSDLTKFGTEVDYHMLTSILIFIFSRFFSTIFLGQTWSQNMKFFRLTEIWYRGRLP